MDAAKFHAVLSCTASCIAKTSDNGLSDTIRLLRERLDEPFLTVNSVTGETGMKQAQEEYDKLIRNKTPKSRR